MGMSSNGGPGGGGPGLNSIVPDAAAKHKQLSELLRPGSSSILGGGPQQGGMVGSQLGAVLGKSPLGQGSTNHQSPQAQKGGAAAGQGNGSTGMGFNQAMLNSGQGHGVMGQAGQVMNGALGPAGRGRPGMQYQGQGMPGAQGPGVGGSVLAETLTQGGPQLGTHNAMNAQQAGNMNKVRVKIPIKWSHKLQNLWSMSDTNYCTSEGRKKSCYICKYIHNSQKEVLHTTIFLPYV